MTYSKIMYSVSVETNAYQFKIPYSWDTTFWRMTGYEILARRLAFRGNVINFTWRKTNFS